MDILVQYLTIDELAEQSKTQIAIIEEKLSSREIKSSVRFSSRPSLWIYKYSEEYAEYRYVEEVTPTGFLEILDYNLVVWTSATSGVIRPPDKSILRRKHIDYKPEKHEVYQFKDDQGNYYRIPAGEEVCIFRHDVLVEEEGTARSHKKRHDTLSQQIEEICLARKAKGLSIATAAIWAELVKSVGQPGSCCTEMFPDYKGKGERIEWKGIQGNYEYLSIDSLTSRLRRRENLLRVR